VIPEPLMWRVHSERGIRALAVPIEHVDLLRTELHEIADHVTPGFDGLAEIREAVRRPARRRTARIAGAFQRVKGLIAP
jgi:hypothetical protein